MEQYTLIISSFFEIFRLKSSDFARNRVSVRVTFYSKRETNPNHQQIIRAYVNISKEQDVGIKQLSNLPKS